MALTGEKWLAHKKAVIEKFGYRCAYCGCEISIDGFHIDHFIPKNRGGRNDFENLFPACNPCNIFKRDWLIEEFRSEIEAQADRLRKRIFTFRAAERFGILTVNEKRVVFFYEGLK